MNKTLKASAKKHNVKLTRKVNGKRVYKSEKELKRQIKNKKKSRKTRKTSKFGSDKKKLVKALKTQRKRVSRFGKISPLGVGYVNARFGKVSPLGLGYVNPFNISMQEQVTGMLPSSYRKHIMASTGTPVKSAPMSLAKANNFYNSYRAGMKLNPGFGKKRRTSRRTRKSCGCGDKSKSKNKK